MTRRKTIGDNPLDAVVPNPTSAAKRPARLQRVKKERLTVHVPVELIDRVKNTVYWTPGLTLATLAEEALRKAVDIREKKRGNPFPSRKEELRGGRPIK